MENAPPAQAPAGVRLKLSVMMFLQFFIWGCWFVTLGTFLAANFQASGAQTGLAFSTQSWGAIIAPFIIGLIAGVLVVYSVLFFDRVKVDDPVGALSVHLVNGVWGTLAVGLFATEGGLFFGGGTAKLLTQAIGVAGVGADVDVPALCRHQPLSPGVCRPASHRA